MTGLTPRSRAYHYGPAASAPHFVYRCYDADDVLLYIGVTSNVKRRMSAHRRAQGNGVASRWLQVCMERYEIEGPFAGREAGRAEERQAIHAEQPLFNYQERKGIDLAAWMTRDPIARYLIERGHVELAIKTLCNCWSETDELGTVESVCVAHRLTAEAGAA